MRVSRAYPVESPANDRMQGVSGNRIYSASARHADFFRETTRHFDRVGNRLYNRVRLAAHWRLAMHADHTDIVSQPDLTKNVGLQHQEGEGRYQLPR